MPHVNGHRQKNKCCKLLCDSPPLEGGRAGGRRSSIAANYPIDIISHHEVVSPSDEHRFFVGGGAFDGDGVGRHGRAGAAQVEQPDERRVSGEHVEKSNNLNLL